MKYILLFICLLFSSSIQAQEVSPYLFIKCDDNKTYELKLTKDFLIEPQSGFLEIRGDSMENSLTIPLNKISQIGFLYRDADVDSAGTSSFIESKIPYVWRIYDKEGRLVRESKANKPDLKDLPAGNIFIISNGSSSFKYLPYK